MGGETIQILLVDDDKDTRTAYEEFFSFDPVIRFQGLGSNEDAMPRDLDADQALLLMIDYHLDSGRCADQWLAAFKRCYGLESDDWPQVWQGYLLAEDKLEITDHIQAVKGCFGLQDILKKPVLLADVEDLIDTLHGAGNAVAAVGEVQEWLDQDAQILIDAADNLNVAIHIFREADLHVGRMYSLNPVYSNSVGKKSGNQWSVQDRNALKRLLSQMRLSGTQRKSSLEFQGEHWWRRRLFKTDNGYLWLSIEQVSEPNQLLMNRLFGGESRLRELDKDRLGELIDNLKIHHGIRRLRLYGAFSLAGPDQNTPKGTNYLYLPYWQKGGGFTGGDTEERWLQQVAGPEFFRPPDTEARERGYWLTSRRDGRVGVEDGNADNKVIFTIKDKGKVVGVLVLDRRDDHLDWRVGSWERQITADELGAMMAWLKDINDVLARFLGYERASRDHDYEQHRSKAQTDALRKGDPEQAVMQLLGDLTKAAYREGYDEQFQVGLLEDQGKGRWRAWSGYEGDSERSAAFDIGEGDYGIEQLAGMVPRASPTDIQWLCQQQLAHDAERGAGLPQSGALLSLRMPLGSAQSALMLIHQPAPHQVTQAFVERWCMNLRRLQPLLCWARADRGARRWIASALSHELREPIQRVISDYALEAAGMTESGDVPAAQVASHAFRYLEQVIGNMLAYSHDGAAQSGTADLYLVLDDIIATLKIYYRDKWSLINPITEVCEVQASESIVRQLLFNLLDNACKYSSGEIRLHWSPPELRLENPLKEAINREELARWGMANERGHATATARGGGHWSGGGPTLGRVEWHRLAYGAGR